MSLADKVQAEQQAVANGATKCAAVFGGDMPCVRVTHLPDDHVHVGQVDAQFVQWEDV